jgi:glycosyltransferase involved in cell wall biosynthesis
MSKLAGVSIVIPAYNEQAAISATIDTVRNVFESHGVKTEVIVVDDGSSDATADIAAGCGATVVRHPENLGYGAALKSGIRCAAHEWIAITDADGTYPADEFPRLLEYVPTFDMVVGARTGKHYHGGLTKRLARFLFRWFSEFVTGRVIPDINSGMRIFRRDFVVSEWEYISSGFSFTTTLTLSMMLSSMFVKYVPIQYNVRVGKSHVRYWRDTLRSAQLIIQVGVWYNPIKIALLLCLSAAAVSLIAGAVVCSLPWLAAPAIILWVGFLCCLLLFALGAHAYICRHIPTAMGSRAIHARDREMDKREAATNGSLAPEPQKEFKGKEQFPER